MKFNNVSYVIIYHPKQDNNQKETSNPNGSNTKPKKHNKTTWKIGNWGVEEEEDEGSSKPKKGHLCLARDSHKQSDLHSSLQNREQLPSAHTSNTFKKKKKSEIYQRG